MIIGVDINNERKAWGERFGMTHFVNPKDLGKDLVPHLVNMTKSGDDQIGGADYTFDCTGNVTVMRQALEACHRAGASRSSSRGTVRRRDCNPALSTGHGTHLERHRLRRRPRPHRRAQNRRLVHGRQIQIDPMITHVMPLADINKAFKLMKHGNRSGVW